MRKDPILGQKLRDFIQGRGSHCIFVLGLKTISWSLSSSQIFSRCWAVFWIFRYVVLTHGSESVVQDHVYCYVLLWNYRLKTYTCIIYMDKASFY